MKTIFTWFYAIEKRIWKEKVQSNPYFATLSLMFVALVGAFAGGGSTFHDWFGWQTEILLLPALGVCVLIAVYNVGESILVSQTTGVAAARGAMLFFATPLMFVLGYVLAVVAMIVVILWLVVGGLTGVLTGRSSKKGVKYKLDDGTELVRETGLLGEESFREKDGTRQFERSRYDSDEVHEI